MIKALGSIWGIPAESKFRQAMIEHVNTLPKNLHIIKTGTTREWILVSDAIFSSYSTSLIESAVACKPSFMLAPVEFPDYLNADWHSMIPHVATYEAFRDAAFDAVRAPLRNELGEWVEREMMSVGDPISNLVDLLAGASGGEVRPVVTITGEEIAFASPEPLKPSIVRGVVSKGRRTLAGVYRSNGNPARSQGLLLHRFRRRCPRFALAVSDELGAFPSLDGRRLSLWPCGNALGPQEMHRSAGESIVIHTMPTNPGRF